MTNNVDAPISAASYTWLTWGDTPNIDGIRIDKGTGFLFLRYEEALDLANQLVDVYEQRHATANNRKGKSND